MKTLLRGRVLSFHADPHETADNHRYIEDGAIVWTGDDDASVGRHGEVLLVR